PGGCPTREGPHIYLVSPRVVGYIRDPAAVRREGRLYLIRRCTKEKFRLAGLGVLRVAQVQGQRPEVFARIRAHLGEGEALAVGGKRVWVRVALTLEQQLCFSRPVGTDPSYGTGARGVRSKGDLFSIRRPDRAVISL